MLVVIDKGDELVPEAFLHHNQPVEAAVAVFKGMDTFEPDMEVQDIRQLPPYSLIRALSSLEICSGGSPYLCGLERNSPVRMEPFRSASLP